MSKEEMESLRNEIVKLRNDIIPLLETIALIRVGGGPFDPPDVRKQRLKEFYGDWVPVQRRYPYFMIHPKAIEAYERHVITLGNEPTEEMLDNLYNSLDPTKKHNKKSVAEAQGISPHDALALLYFLSISGKGKYLNTNSFVRNDYVAPETTKTSETIEDDYV